MRVSPTETISITRAVPSNDFGMEGFAHVTVHGFHLHGSEKVLNTPLCLDYVGFWTNAESTYKIPHAPNVAARRPGSAVLIFSSSFLSRQFEVWMQALAPGVSTNIHRHMSEESITILEVSADWDVFFHVCSILRAPPVH